MPSGHQFHQSPYDIMLGSDFLSLLSIVLNYDQGTIHWDGFNIPMKKLGALEDCKLCEAIYFANSHQYIRIQDLDKHQQQILDAEYSKMDIDALVDALFISLKSKQQLKATLKQFLNLLWLVAD